MKTKMQLLRSPEDLVKAYLCYCYYGPNLAPNIDVQEYFKNYPDQEEHKYIVAKFFYEFKQRRKSIRCFLAVNFDKLFYLLFTKDMVNFYDSILMDNDSFDARSIKDLSNFIKFKEIKEFI